MKIMTLIYLTGKKEPFVTQKMETGFGAII